MTVSAAEALLAEIGLSLRRVRYDSAMRRLVAEVAPMGNYSREASFLATGTDLENLVENAATAGASRAARSGVRRWRS